MRIAHAFLVLAIIAASGGKAQTIDFSGDVSLQARWYPESPAYFGQRSKTAGVVAEPSLYAVVGESTSFTFTPLGRYDSADSRRTHMDLREAYLLTYGDWKDVSWEIRLGLDRVFWGVAELHNLVDIVNQLDLVEHPRDRPKLGQPMAHLTLSGDWGIAQGFLLPYHRKRTFPGRSGRLRAERLIDANALYESSAEEHHVDLAVRYSNTLGSIDFGLSAFRGTSRDPFFIAPSPADPVAPKDLPWVPYYEQIRQYGLDAQITRGPWLYKLEAIRRSGARNLLGREEDYSAFILGLERSLYSVFGSNADVTLLGEWLGDSRGRRATSVWANDLFVAAFLAFNDVQSTELLAGFLADLRYDYSALNMELKRRISANWSMRFEMIANLSSDPDDLTYAGRRDSFVGVELTYSF